MKKVKEQIVWNKQPENRKWKRIINSIELFFFALIGAASVLVVHIYGNGSNLQSTFILIASFLILSTAFMALAVLQEKTFFRWHITVIKFGFLCGVTNACLAGYLILEVQGVNT
ncbi:MAG: hypothetical protein ACRBHB_06710 [Arenicella sp.]